MNSIGIARYAWRVIGLVLVVVLPAGGYDPARLNGMSADLTPLPSKGLLDVPPDRQGVKVFDPITPYTIAQQAPKVECVALPVFYDADWTIWASGCLHSTGRVYLAMGDHQGINGDSFLYEFNPSTRRLRCLAGLRKAAKDFQWGEHGFGRVHGRICEGPDGKLYFSSLWSPDSDLSEYKGGRMFCFDPSTEKLTDLGIPVPDGGALSAALDPARMILYGEFEYPTGGTTDFVAYDLEKRHVLFRGGHADEPNAGRGIIVDAAGCAYYACAGTVRKYDPQTNSLSDLPDRLPHRKLREHTSRPRSDGAYYAATWAPQDSSSWLVLIDGQGGKVTPITTLWTNVKALDIDPTGRWLYYVVDAPLDAEGLGEIPQELKDAKGLVAGLPVVQVDLAQGATQKVIAFLEIPLRQALRWDKRSRFTCYTVLVSADGKTLYVTLNGRVKCDRGFYHTTPLFVVVHIPPQEIAIK